MHFVTTTKGRRVASWARAQGDHACVPSTDAKMNITQHNLPKKDAPPGSLEGANNECRRSIAGAHARRLLEVHPNILCSSSPDATSVA